MRMVLITKHAPRLECPECGGHHLHIPVWDDDPYAPPQADPLEDGFCLDKGCGFKGFRMDFDPTGLMKAQWIQQSQ